MKYFKTLDSLLSLEPGMTRNKMCKHIQTDPEDKSVNLEKLNRSYASERFNNKQSISCF